MGFSSTFFDDILYAPSSSGDKAVAPVFDVVRAPYGKAILSFLCSGSGPSLAGSYAAHQRGPVLLYDIALEDLSV